MKVYIVSGVVWKGGLHRGWPIRAFDSYEAAEAYVKSERKRSAEELKAVFPEITSLRVRGKEKV